jgi:Asp-tRNA(Asn)/Glu-tRNA(Gln) amidotransferase A subunit family amidase
LLYDAALLGNGDAHENARTMVYGLEPWDIRIGAPMYPYLHTRIPPDLQEQQEPALVSNSITVNPDVRAKYDATVQAMGEAGFSVLQQEWPSRFYDYLGREENVAVEALYSKRPVNGKPYAGSSLAMYSFSGQVAEFVRSYLNAPVSLNEIKADVGTAGASHHPANSLASADTLDETQYRYFMGPGMAYDEEAYNSYFDHTGADLLLLPGGRAATPDLAALANGTVPLTPLDSDGNAMGVTYNGTASDAFSMHFFSFKHLHIPKMSVPLGLTPDGRPCSMQLWGKAVPYKHMYDDAYSRQHDAHFLQLVTRVVTAMHAIAPSLRRVDSSFATFTTAVPSMPAAGVEKQTRKARL